MAFSSINHGIRGSHSLIIHHTIDLEVNTDGRLQDTHIMIPLHSTTCGIRGLFGCLGI